jgi:hypothetical protein
MAAGNNRPRIIIDNKKKNSFKLCCDEQCVEIAVSEGDSPQSLGSAKDSGSEDTSHDQELPGLNPTGFFPSPLPLNPLPIGSRTIYTTTRIVVGSIDHLLHESERIRRSWSFPQVEEIAIDGMIIFDVYNVSEIDIKQLEPVQHLSMDTTYPVVLRLLD